MINHAQNAANIHIFSAGCMYTTSTVCVSNDKHLIIIMFMCPFMLNIALVNLVGPM